MVKEKKYHLPPFVVEKLMEDFSLSSNEMKKVEDAFTFSSKFNYPTANTLENWQKISIQIVEQPFVLKQTPTFRLNYWWSAAAVLILSLSILLWQFSTPHSSPTISKNYNSTNSVKEFTLDDGSKVVLNKYSEMVVSFSKTNRNVTLNGEARFEVTHNNLPFTVNTKAGSIEVLGTIFNVKNRANIPLSIALHKGSIQFNTLSNKIKLLPGECITQKNDHTFIKSNTTDENTNDWIENKLVFENKDLKEIISELQIEYNVVFEYNEDLQNEKITITFDNLNAKQAAELLSKTLNTSIKIK